jgi:predicted RNase H-like HicB family nuclease
VRTRTFVAVIHRGNEWYVAGCPQVGTVSQGRTIEEAVANLKEATELYLEQFPAPAETGPVFVTTSEVSVPGHR